MHIKTDDSVRHDPAKNGPSGIEGHYEATIVVKPDDPGTTGNAQRLKGRAGVCQILTGQKIQVHKF